MAKMKIEISGFEQILRRMTELEGNVKKTTEEALRKTHEIVTDYAEKGMAHSNLPAGGQYSTGETLKSLRREANIEWNGSVASVPVGFDIKHGGLASIMLMYGTPRMKKDQKLYNAFYSAKTKKEVVAAQEEIFWKEIRRLEG